VKKFTEPVTIRELLENLDALKITKFQKEFVKAVIRAMLRAALNKRLGRELFP
jgi:hypothetical protein